MTNWKKVGKYIYRGNFSKQIFQAVVLYRIVTENYVVWNKMHWENTTIRRRRIIRNCRIQRFYWRRWPRRRFQPSLRFCTSPVYSNPFIVSLNSFLQDSSFKINNLIFLFLIILLIPSFFSTSFLFKFTSWPNLFGSYFIVFFVTAEMNREFRNRNFRESEL